MKNGERQKFDPEQIFDLQGAGECITRSADYIRDLCHEQKIRYFREGSGEKKKYLIRRKWIEEYLANNCEEIEPINSR